MVVEEPHEATPSPAEYVAPTVVLVTGVLAHRATALEHESLPEGQTNPLHDVVPAVCEPLQAERIVIAHDPATQHAPEGSHGLPEQLDPVVHVPVHEDWPTNVQVVPLQQMPGVEGQGLGEQTPFWVKVPVLQL